MNPTHLAVAALILAMPNIPRAEDSKSEKIETPAGPITTTTQTVDPVPQEITLASTSDVQGFVELAAQAKQFVATYVGLKSALSLQTLDEAFRNWQTEETRRYSEQKVTQILGAYLGNMLTSQLEMEWVVVKDQYGTDFAVRSKKVEVLAFPFASVGKRIERSEYDFLVGVYYAIEHTLKNGDHKAR